MAVVYRNGRAYAYKSVRRDGKVVTTYRGSGLLAELIEVFDKEEREQRSARRATELNEKAEMESLDRAMGEYCARIDDLTHAVLLASGFHQHKRQWRKKRGKKEA